MTTPFLTPYKSTPSFKRRLGAAGGGEVSLFSPKMSPVPNALETPNINLRKEDSKMGASSISRAGGAHTVHTPASSKTFDLRTMGSSTRFGAFDEASLRSHNLDGTCQASSIYMNHLAITHRSTGIIEFRQFKEDSSDIGSLHPKNNRVSCGSPIIDFFFLTFSEQRADECHVIVATADQLCCHSNLDSNAVPVYLVSQQERCSRVLSCDGVCVVHSCYIAISVLLPDASCVIQVIQYEHSRQEKARLIQQIPISSGSAVLRWRKGSCEEFQERKRLWLVCGDSDGFATLFECRFSSDFALSSVVASDAYPVSCLPITSVDTSDSLASILSGGACSLLSFDLDAATLRPLKGVVDAFLSSVDKCSKILAASVFPDGDCVAVLRSGCATPDVSLEVLCGVRTGLAPAPSLKYGLQPFHRSFTGSAASLSWYCTSNGCAIAACTARWYCF
jgi:hypothetical protein